MAASLATAALSATLVSGVSASTLQGDPPREPGCPSSPAEPPFKDLKLNGLKAEKRMNWPGPPCTVRVWGLALDGEGIGRQYSGGEFFLYVRGVGQVGGFLNGDILTRTVSRAELVFFTDVRSYPRTEVRYGDTAHPEQAQVVASVEVCGP